MPTNDHPESQARERERPRERAEADTRVQEAVDEQQAHAARQAARRHRTAWPDARRPGGGERRGEPDRGGHRGELQGDLSGCEARDQLQVEGGEEEHEEHAPVCDERHDVADGEEAVAEPVESQHRIGGSPLVPHKRRRRRRSRAE
jgi:hypothetical protein